MRKFFIGDVIEAEDQILNAFARYHRQQNDHWWRNPKTGRKVKRNRAEQMMLMVSEIAEAMEGLRKGTQDDHLPELPSEVVEFADLYIRLMDYVGEYWPNFGEVVKAKHAYNRTRKDHTNKARLAKGGKKF